MALGTSLPTLLAASTGAVHYVDAAIGDDARSAAVAQNPATPWASFQKLLDTLTPGQIGQIASGIYASPSLARHTLSARSGTSLNPIEVRAAPGATVQIRPKVSGGSDAFIVTSASSFWRFRGLIFELAEVGSNHQNMWISDSGGGCTDIEFWNCTFRYAKQGTGTFIAEGNTRCYYINCKAHDNIDTVNPGTQRQGFYITGDNCMAINCLTYNHDGYGLQVRTNDADGPVGVIVANCVAYNNKPSIGTSEYAGFLCEGLADNCHFHNNISVANRNGFRGITAGSPSPHNIASFNIANGNLNTQYGRSGSTTALDYANDGSGNYVGPGDNLTSDPLFINAAALDFHLQAASPARGYGIDTYCPTFDFDNNVRSVLDAGIYRYSAGGPDALASKDAQNILAIAGGIAA